MATSYADSAQAREMDRRYDKWGNPVVPRHAHCHEYDTEARAASDAEYRKNLSKRLAVAMGQVEAFYYPKVKQ